MCVDTGARSGRKRQMTRQRSMFSRFFFLGGGRRIVVGDTKVQGDREITARHVSHQQEWEGKRLALSPAIISGESADCCSTISNC